VGYSNEGRMLVKKMGVDDVVENHLAEKLVFYVLQIDNLSSAAANILKQTALSRGTDAVIHRDVITGKIQNSSVVISGTKKEFKYISDSLKNQPFQLGDISNKILELVSFLDKRSHTKIMGVLNITPDSFSDGGLYLRPEDAIKRIEEMIGEGAEIIDIGGESSRPGAEPIGEEEELKRVIPVIDAIKKKKVRFSIDTYRSKVAQEALKRGAEFVNDISGMRFDKNMVKVVSDYNARVIIMHMKGTPKNMQRNPVYEDVIDEIMNFFAERIVFCEKNGVKRENIILDPGIGFGKRLEDNLKILKNLIEFRSFGTPVMIGASRKSFIKGITGAPVDERLAGSLAAVSEAFLQGIDYVRVHDVKETKQYLDVISAIEESI